MTEYKGYPGSNQFTDNESLKKILKGVSWPWKRYNNKNEAFKKVVSTFCGLYSYSLRQRDAVRNC